MRGARAVTAVARARPRLLRKGSRAQTAVTATPPARSGRSSAAGDIAANPQKNTCGSSRDRRRRRGPRLARRHGVGARAVTQLVAWQHLSDLRRVIITIVRRHEARDRRLCERALVVTASATRTLVEAAATVVARDAARLLRATVRALAEIQGHVSEACARGYISARERDEGLLVARRAIGAVVRLSRRRRCPPLRPAGHDAPLRPDGSGGHQQPSSRAP